MEIITELSKINFISYIIATCLIFISFKTCMLAFEWIIEFFGIETKWMRKKREEHDLLLKTSQNLADLQKKQSDDIKQSDEHDRLIRDELNKFMEEIRNSISETKKEIKQFTINRLNDREQSLKIQKELKDSIVSVSDNEKERGKQIEALMCGSKELLGAEIDKRYREYISLDGIPESEVDEFNEIFNAYKGLKGNHSRDTKYHYVKEHLQVLPVETKLIIKKE